MIRPTLAVDAFEVADQQHAEVASRRQRWTAKARRIVHSTLRFDEPIETCRDQNRLQLVVKGVTGRARHLRPQHQQLILSLPLSSKGHPSPAVLIRQLTNQTRADFVNGLLSGVPRTEGASVAARSERIANGEPSVDYLAFVQVLREQRRALCL